MGFLTAMQILLSSAWNMMSSVTFPGTGISISSIAVGTVIAVVALRIVNFVLGLRFSGGSGAVNREDKGRRL